MHFRSIVVLGLFVLLPISVALAQGQGDGDAMTPVGAWDFDLSGFQKALVVFNFGGTTTNTASSGPLATAYGSWEKSGERGIDTSFYFLAVDEAGEHLGYIKVMAHYVLEDKDTLVGESEVWFLGGTDPLDPDFELFLGLSTDTGRRLKPEAPS